MINLRLLLTVLGLFFTKLALLMVIPAVVAMGNHEASGFDFVQSAGITAVVAGLCVAFGHRNAPVRMRARDMFLLTTLVWVLFSSLAALPLMLAENISYTDAYFETMSGVTTTGSTVLTHLSQQPESILLWRSILQWLGGIGFIVMGVGILPYLNVGGMRLYHTESSDWSDKEVPRLQNYAIQLFKVYALLSAVCALCYYLSGMTLFEAVNHAMTTLSTGGYSTDDRSMAAFSPAAHWVGILFMTAGGTPLLLYIQALKHHRWRQLWEDQQVRGFLALLLVASAALATYLYVQQDISWLDALRLSMFNVVSVVTTTGYALTDYSSWGSFAVAAFFILMFIGGCSGSTAGGLKIFRFQVAWAMVQLHMKRSIHPYGVFVARYNKRNITPDISQGVLTLLFLFLLTMCLLTLALSLCGLDIVTALTGAITAVCNVGPGLGDIIGPAGNFAEMPNAAKWLLSAGMLAGRLEITTVAILFLPRFWRK